ncbi:MAG: hypothetical protein HC858_11100 [Brachymonas sp.]|nr:hypothetical protein [Brachymonas sp.]
MASDLKHCRNYTCCMTNSIWITIDRFEGSSPREVGAWMRVTADAVEGTVGGGHLEFDAIAKARSWLAQVDEMPAANEQIHRYALGPRSGKRCGVWSWLQNAVS